MKTGREGNRVMAEGDRHTLQVVLSVIYGMTMNTTVEDAIANLLAQNRYRFPVLCRCPLFCFALICSALTSRQLY
ncbi:MAG: hypothetical protein F6K30_13345 [Cyanothece sp. SIO2G6]|nr:hypothetical protein [Cyanothece sp. SIO2G6]